MNSVKTQLNADVT